MTYLQHLLIIIHCVPMGETAMIEEIQRQTGWPLCNCLTTIRTMEGMGVIQHTQRGYRLLPAGIVQIATLIKPA